MRVWTFQSCGSFLVIRGRDALAKVIPLSAEVRGHPDSAIPESQNTTHDCTDDSMPPTSTHSMRQSISAFGPQPASSFGTNELALIPSSWPIATPRTSDLPIHDTNSDNSIYFSTELGLEQASVLRLPENLRIGKHLTFSVHPPKSESPHGLVIAVDQAPRPLYDTKRPNLDFPVPIKRDVRFISLPGSLTKAIGHPGVRTDGLLEAGETSASKKRGPDDTENEIDAGDNRVSKRRTMDWLFGGGD